MARIGVQFQDIEKAALELHGSGKIPTVDGIRELLGTGSKTTITHHLRAWRAKQDEAGGHLPHELQALVTGLWKRLHEQADQRVEEVEKEHEAQRLALQQELTLLQQHYTQLQQRLHHSEESGALERLAKLELEKQLHAVTQEHLKLTERYQAALHQNETTKAENARLHQLAANMQANMEHYQEAVHQRQQQQTLAMEKQQGIYAEELAQLKQQCLQHEGRATLLEKELAQVQQAHEQTEKQYNKLQGECQATSQTCQELDRERSRLLERDAHSHQTIQALQLKAEKESVRVGELEQKMAVLASLNERLNHEITVSQDKVEILRQEKLFLAQEKAQMEGYLKQVKHVELSGR